MRVLILEPEGVWCEMLMGLIEWSRDTELKVITSRNSEIVKVSLQLFVPHQIIMSWSEGGQRLLSIIRGHRWPPGHDLDLRVWVLSGYDPRDIHVEAADADLILNKAEIPFSALNLMLRHRAEVLERLQPQL